MIKRKKPRRKPSTLLTKMIQRKIKKIKSEILKEEKFYKNPEFD
jgi:hypothetical protein